MQCLDAVALGVRSSVVYQGVKHAAANLGSPYTVSERTCYNVLLAHKATDVVLSPLGTTDLKSIKL
ncbi:MAG: hypothetical protein S4CHLAM45_05190 [Chlamydiales bacterium]|nr:hypothetical protein [Chlamydiales bacterium]MCH9619940.1 hypothetical protein [Chlamydiales bacterium]MCH9622633.1 hypothetical protein [Chlamydiales bacterium]